MAENLWSFDWNTRKAYKHSGSSATILDSVSIALGVGEHGITADQDGNLYMNNRTGAPRIYRFSGFSSTVDASIATTSSTAALTWDGADIYESKNTADELYRYSGFTTTVRSSIQSPGWGAGGNPLGMTHDGTDTHSADYALSKIYEHSAFTTTIKDSFNAAGSNGRGLTWDGTNSINIDNVSAKIYIYSGFSSTVTDSFNDPGTLGTGVTWEEAGTRLNITHVTVTPSVLNLTSSIINISFLKPQLYNRFRKNLMNGLVDLNGSGAHEIKVALLDSNYTFSPDHNLFTEISGDEVSGTGYTAGGEILSNLNVVQENNSDRARFDADDVVWSTSTITARYLVLYDNTLVTKDLIFCIDLEEDKVSERRDFTVRWNDLGLLVAG